MIIDSDYKLCKPNKTVYCNKLLPYSNFSKNRNNPDGHENRCKSCRNKHGQLEREKDPFKYFMKNHSTKKNYRYPFLIKPEDIPGVKVRYYYSRGKLIWETIEYPKYCQYSGQSINWLTDNTDCAGPTIDRWDNSIKVYQPGNVFLVRRDINLYKGTKTIEEWNSIMKQNNWIIQETK